MYRNPINEFPFIGAFLYDCRGMNLTYAVESRDYGISSNLTVPHRRKNINLFFSYCALTILISRSFSDGCLAIMIELHFLQQPFASPLA